MAEMKNICGKIPLELHAKVRQEIEQREISTQQFIQQVIEEHFTEKGGQVSMAVRTVAVQVSEELFARFKAAVAKKGCKQKDFLIALIERAIEEIEAEFGEENASAPPAEQEPENREMESEGTEASEAEEPAETEAEEPKEPAEPEAEVPEESADAEEPDETEAREPKEADGVEDGEPEASENEEASGPETAGAGEAEQEPDDTVTEE